MTSTTIAPLDTLRASLSGSLALPGEDAYAAATPWNVAVPLTAAAVVTAADASDVVTTVKFAAAHDLGVAVRATGHGAVPTGDALVLRTSGLQELSVNVEEKWARIGAGVVWQQVLDLVTPHGLAPLLGSAPGVGVVGYLTGGGLGPLVRTFGASADHVRAIEVVTGDGELRRVTPETYPDLFWGLRGGKGTLGIVTAIEIDLFALPTIYGGAVYFDGADAPAVLHAWRSWVADLPEHSSTSVAILQLPPLPSVPRPLAGRMTVAVRFASVAPVAEAEALFAPLRAVAPALIDMVGEMPYAAIGMVHADPVDPMPTLEDAELLGSLPVEAVDALLAAAGPGSSSVQTIVELRLLGGALARPPKHRSALCHRDAAFSLLAIGVPAGPPAALVPGDNARVLAALAPWATGGAVPNFGASADPARMARAYDEDSLHWLRSLATQYDPAGVFRVGQVVRPVA